METNNVNDLESIIKNNQNKKFIMKFSAVQDFTFSDKILYYAILCD